MREAGLAGVSRRRQARTTIRDERVRPAADLVDRHFRAEKPNQLWVADITYVPTWAGFLYLAVVLDAFSRRVVGWAMSIDLRAQIVLDALNMALWQRRPAEVTSYAAAGRPRDSRARRRASVRVPWSAIPGRPDPHSDRPARVAGAAGHLGAV